jgi:gamma-glutamylcyclotransferase (GGCT)/AIG2-like uncharacterized protein YtfP
MPETSQHLFVYGTLLPDLFPGRAPKDIADILSEARRVGTGQIHGLLYDLGQYPGAVLDPESQCVFSGEILELPTADVLARLDEYEEVDATNPERSLFLRVKSPVTLEDGRALQCWLYVYNQDPGSAPLVQMGDYRLRSGNHRRRQV